RLELRPAEAIDVDRVVALPRLEGAPIDGIPQTISGFVPVDAHCRVHGVDGVFAAGDITSFTVKQGGIATQQADAAAEAIAAAVGADVEPRRFRPVLRGLLLTGREPRFLRRELSIDPGQEPLATVDSLWWPPAKIVGRHLGPFLASFAGADWAEPTTAAVPGAVEVEVVVDAEETLGHQLPPLDARYEVDDDRVEEAMSVAT